MRPNPGLSDAVFMVRHRLNGRDVDLSKWKAEFKRLHRQSPAVRHFRLYAGRCLGAY